MNLDGFHLPGIPPPPTTIRSYPAREGAPPLELRMADLTPALLRRQIEALRRARARSLLDRPIRSIVRSVDRVAQRLLDPAEPLRRIAEDAISATTGASRSMSTRVLEGMAAGWREEALLGLLESEFGSVRVLEEFAPRPGSRTRSRAVGPELSVHILSGNVPGVGVTSLIRALLVRSASLGKSAAGEPALAPLFAHTLAEVDPELGACVAVTYWTGGDEELERCAFAEADAILAYGSSETIEQVRARAPRSARVLVYPSRLSFGIIARDALTPEEAPRVAADAALAVATFDQQGCVSPHLFYVEEGGALSPEEFATRLAEAMERLATDLPRGSITPGEAAAIRQARGEAEFGQLAGRNYRLHAPPDTSWTVIVDPDPAFTASCLQRLVRVKPLDGLERIPALVRPFAPVLQSIGVAGGASRLGPLATEFARLGASRITPLARMPWPPAAWHHDGGSPLRDLVHWCDWEGEE